MNEIRPINYQVQFRYDRRIDFLFTEIVGPGPKDKVIRTIPSEQELARMRQLAQYTKVGLDKGLILNEMV